jgi:hypothetical protein
VASWPGGQDGAVRGRKGAVVQAETVPAAIGRPAIGAPADNSIS